MICIKCGQEIPDDSRFCTSCGAPQETPAEPDAQVEPETSVEPDALEEMPNTYAQSEESTEATTSEQSAPDITPGWIPNSQPESSEQVGADSGQSEQSGQLSDQYVQWGPLQEPEQTKKGLSKPVLYGIIGGSIFLVAALITLLIVFLVSHGKTTYNLQDYTDVTFDGIDGHGTVDASINESDLAEEIAKDMGYDVDKLRDMEFDDILGDGLADMLKLYSAISAIQVKVTPEEDLSNGDTVTISYVFDEDKAKEVNAEFVGEPMTKPVSGLEEVRAVDPFEHVEVSFEGTSPNAYISWEVDYQEDWESAIYFDVSDRDGLRVGDKVTLSVEGYDEDSFASYYGVTFETTEKEYTVENVDSYIVDEGELDPAALDIMMTATEQYIEDYFADSSRSSQISASDIKYEGYYLLINKADEVWWGYNKVYMIYSATVKSTEKPKSFKPAKVYFPIEYQDIKKLADGSYSIETSYKSILGSTDLQFGYWQTVSGYLTQEMMKSELIDADSANYDGHVYGSLEK